MIKIGDRIRFLNEVGGGVITKIINKDMVAVLDEDGFETPVLKRECVVIDTTKTTPTPFVSNETISAEKQSTPINSPTSLKNIPYESEPDTTYGEQLYAYLAFVPVQLQQLQTTSFDLYLINDSNYAMLFTLAVKESGQLSCREHGVLTSNTKLHIEKLSKEQLHETHELTVQCIAFKQHVPYQLKQPFGTTITISFSDFGKLHLFKENDYFDESAMIFPLIEKDLPAAFLRLEASEIEQAMKGKNDLPSVKSTIEKLRKKHTDIIELDLHSSQLLDNTAGMDNTAILQFQLDTFRKILAEYKNKKGQKIVVIHGKGEGVLRNAIIQELKTHYRNYLYQDASFREYGFGATMITIR
jgi:hypothetical protein